MLRSTPTLCLLAGVFGFPAAGQTNSTNSTATTSAWPPYSPTSYPIFHLSDDDEFYFMLETFLSLANNGGASTGEVLRAATQFVPTDFESTYEPFYYLAQQIQAIADSIDRNIDPVGAREAYYRASTYYRACSFHLIGNQSDPRLFTTWDQALVAFDNANSLLDVPGERFSLPSYTSDLNGSFEAIGVFYKAERSDRRLPTVLIGNGYDGSQEDNYHYACMEILKRGLNCATYEGPGQPTVRRKQDIGFVSDWWAVTTPIIDYLHTRPDVDVDRIALVGVSFGGSLAPLAASHDDRYSAIILIDGLPSLQQVLSTSFGPKFAQLYASGNVTLYDETIDSLRRDPSQDSEFRWIEDQSQWAFDTTSAYEAFTRLGKLSWGPAEAANLTMPVFVAKGQNDASTLNQPELAYQYLTQNRTNGFALTTYHEFLTALGAGEHCHIGAEAQLWQVVLGWLSEVWDGYSYARDVSWNGGPGSW